MTFTKRTFMSDYHFPPELLDSTLLRESVSPEEIRQLCSDAKSNGFYAVCILPEFVQYSYALVAETPVKVVSVVSFPHGSDSTIDKCKQTEQLIKAGADEIDMAMNFEKFVRGDYEYVLQDIAAVIEAAKSFRCSRDEKSIPRIKVIIESAYLRTIEIKKKQSEGTLLAKAAELVTQAHADFLKTSTGLHAAGGVHKNDVPFFKSVLPESVHVKAAGGIRTEKFARSLREQGVDRIGTSSAVAIVRGI